MYDLNGDGYISGEEMLYLLKDCLNEQPMEEDPDEGIRDLVEITLSNMVRRQMLLFPAECNTSWKVKWFAFAGPRP